MFCSILKNSMPLAWRTSQEPVRSQEQGIKHLLQEGLNYNLPVLQGVLTSTGLPSIFSFSLHFGSVFLPPGTQSSFGITQTREEAQSEPCNKEERAKTKNDALHGWLQILSEVFKSSVPKTVPLCFRDSLISWQRCSKSLSISSLTME